MMAELRPYYAQLDVERRRLIVGALTRCKGNRARAAEELGLKRTHLLTLIVRLGLRAAVEELWPYAVRTAPRKI